MYYADDRRTYGADGCGMAFSGKTGKYLGDK
jgi:hypothetical protein